LKVDPLSNIIASHRQPYLHSAAVVRCNLSLIACLLRRRSNRSRELAAGESRDSLHRWRASSSCRHASPRGQLCQSFSHSTIPFLHLSLGSRKTTAVERSKTREMDTTTFVVRIKRNADPEPCSQIPGWCYRRDATDYLKTPDNVSHMVSSSRYLPRPWILPARSAIQTPNH
jgi:hypothetical protein